MTFYRKVRKGFAQSSLGFFYLALLLDRKGIVKIKDLIGVMEDDIYRKGHKGFSQSLQSFVFIALCFEIAKVL